MFRTLFFFALWLLPLHMWAQLPAQDEGCYYYASVVRMRGMGEQLVQEYHFTPLLYSKDCLSREEVVRSIRKAFFSMSQDPNVRENHIFLSGPMREEDEAEDAYWKALQNIPPYAKRHLMPMKLD